ncbi:LysM peptidoglycan-binding domain-containing protein [Fructilactobacillus lindneri]|uniref:LysM peptidoglycan-binding domain-containing protein n=1 Tax=Fructilactobacillus lindneri TaxID=53444 RepID=UPI000CD40B64|nr:LysM domain-containing protein [Fructilactobacillus lindneri]POG99039.1 hypothetical protein BGL32_06310 [Fructilactobacillus lindneri]POH01531.1 hypothetical protein BGL33_05395 [Fructilactobacillus lindneri]
MKSKGLKSIVALSAVSLGVLFAGANSANASTKVTVQSGDTLSKIAKTYNVSIQSLQEANKIQDINRIYAGETFIIGNDGDVQVAASSAQTAPTTVKAPVAAPAQQTQPVQAQQAAKPATTTPAAQPAKPAQVAAPAQQTQPAAKPAAQPVQTVKPAATQQPVQKQQTTQAVAQPAQAAAPAKATTTNNSAATNNDGSLDSIAAVESGNNYNARNGQYIGKYQLSSSYLNGDYSPANQEAVARQYAISRYGSVANAVAYRSSHNYW